MKEISKQSRKNARKKMINIDEHQRQPKMPPGRKATEIPAIQISPSTPRKVSAEHLEPTRMNITMVVS